MSHYFSSNERGTLALVLVLAAALGACGDDRPPTTDGGGGQTSGSQGGDGPFRLSFEPIDVEGDLGIVTDLEFLPGSTELLIVSLDGRVGHYRIDGDAATLLGTFEVPGVYRDLDCGLLSVTLDPEFADNGLLYVGACISQQDSAIYRLHFDPTDYAAIADSSAEIFVAGDPKAPRPWHNIGSIGFDDTGALWALFGDKRVASNGQDATNALSALVRIIPARTGEGFEPAPDNPFVDDPDLDPTVYAYGLRSPWRGTFDGQGRWFFGDVGANGFEEINMVSAPGENFGWAAHEGPCESDCEGITDPVTAWAHDEITEYMSDDPDVVPTNARVAWAAGPYRGTFGDRYRGHLDDRVLFGDYCLGFVRGLSVDAGGTVVADEHLGHLALPVAWREAVDGYLYTATFGKCETLGLDPDDPPTSRLYRVVGVGGD